MSCQVIIAFVNNVGGIEFMGFRATTRLSTFVSANKIANTHSDIVIQYCVNGTHAHDTAWYCRNNDALEQKFDRLRSPHPGKYHT